MSRLSCFLFALCISNFAFSQKQEIEFWKNSIESLKPLNSAHEVYNELTRSASHDSLYSDVDFKSLGACYILTSADFNNGIELDSLLQDYLKNHAKYISNKSLQLWIHAQIGFYYYCNNEYLQSLPWFLVANDLFKMLNDESLLFGPEILKKTGYYYSTISKYDISNDLLKRSYALCKDSSNRANLLNSIGTNYLKLGNFTQAESYLYRAIVLSNEISDFDRLARCLGELAKLEEKKGNLEKAIKLYKKDLYYSQLVNSERNTMYARLQLADVYLHKNELDSSHKYAILALNYSSMDGAYDGYQDEITQILLKISFLRNNGEDELFYRRKLDSLNQKNALGSGLEAINLANFKISEHFKQWEINEHKQHIEKEQSEKKSFGFLVLGVIFLSMLLFTLYSRIKLKEKKVILSQIETFEEAKRASEQKLEMTQSTLDSYTSYLQEKNTQIESLEIELEKIKNSKLHNKQTEEQENKFQALMESHLMTDENWNKFKELFVKEQPDYYYFLMNNFSDLTESNLRVLLLQKLGLNNQGIANLLGLTIDGVKKAKQRMRKKYGIAYSNIENGENLSS